MLGFCRVSLAGRLVCTFIDSPGDYVVDKIKTVYCQETGSRNCNVTPTFT